MLFTTNIFVAFSLMASSNLLASAAPADSSYERAQQALTNKCKEQVQDPLKIWHNKYCDVAAVGQPADDPIGTFVYDNFGGDDAPAPKDIERPYLSELEDVSQVESAGGNISKQRYIDSFYGYLSEIGGPYPSDASQVIAAWEKVDNWTGRCQITVAPFDWGSYLLYSSTESPRTCKGPTHD